jgi:hypothetical protein
MGASRWLDANPLAGTSKSAMAKATIFFNGFIVSSGLKLVDVAGRWDLATGTWRHVSAASTGSVYELKYAGRKKSDL